jgi:hypothetical protein
MLYNPMQMLMFVYHGIDMPIKEYFTTAYLRFGRLNHIPARTVSCPVFDFLLHLSDRNLADIV